MGLPPALSRARGDFADNGPMSVLIVFCNCPDETSAERMATALVEERLAACVNRIAGVASTYRWQGKVCRDNEHLLLIKTTSERFAALCERILALHPYELPEVIAVDIVHGSAPYLDWIAAETHG
jgi:periplasmic divalent cation tolerance protein